MRETAAQNRGSFWKGQLSARGDFRAKSRHMGYAGANRKLVDEGVIAPVGNGRARRYVPAGQHVT